MRTSVWVTLLIILLLAGGVIWYLNRDGNGAIIPAPTDNNGGTSNGSGSNGDSTLNDQIRVTSPQSNSIIASPLTVTGEARGTWYFEASFPIRIVDANGRQLGISHAQAQGEWMTTSFVPFIGTLTFTNPTTPTGTLILEKDNPSGLPQNAAEIRIPVRFNTSTSMRAIKLYFYDQNRDRDASGAVRCSSAGLVAFDRSIPFTNTPIQDSVRELLRGPTSTERLQASNTEFPLAGVTLTGASLSGGVLTLSFNDPQNRTGGGSCRVNVLRAQIETTAKQFGGVSQVRYAPPGVFEP